MASLQNVPVLNDNSDADLGLNLDSCTIPELLEMLSRHHLSALQDKGEPHSTFLCTAASDAEISELQARLGTAKNPCELPSDYVDFLKTSNGFYLHDMDEADSEPDLEAIFHSAKNVQQDNWIDLGLFKANPLLHPLPVSIHQRFDWPDMSGIDIGPAGDEGNLWLFGPQQLRLAKERVESIYPHLPEDDQKTLDGLIAKLYGSREIMNQQQWTILEFFHWSPDVDLHLGFRAYLERAVQRSRDSIQEEH